MLGFAVAFYYIFSHKPYVDAAAAQVPCITSCFKMLDLRDMYGDVREHFVDPIPLPIPGLVRRYQKKKKKKESSPEEEEDEGEQDSVGEEQHPLLLEEKDCTASEGVIETVMTREVDPQEEGMGARERRHSGGGGGGGGGIVIIGESWEDVKRNLSPLETDSQL